MRAPLLAAILLVSSGCFRSPQPYPGPSAEVDARPLVGCYRAWYHEVEEGRPSNRWFFRLDSAGSEDGIGGGRGVPGARRSTASIQRRYGSHWRPIPGGVQLHVGDTIRGVVADFRAAGDSLVGRAFHFTETRWDYYVEPVSARKIPCAQADTPP